MKLLTALAFATLLPLANSAYSQRGGGGHQAPLPVQVNQLKQTVRNFAQYTSSETVFYVRRGRIGVANQLKLAVQSARQFNQQLQAARPLPRAHRWKIGQLTLKLQKAQFHVNNAKRLLNRRGFQRLDPKISRLLTRSKAKWQTIRQRLRHTGGRH